MKCCQMIGHFNRNFVPLGGRRPVMELIDLEFESVLRKGVFTFLLRLSSNDVNETFSQCREAKQNPK